LNKYLEPIALKHASGLTSVSASYIDQLRARYPVLLNMPARVIPFGAFTTDLDIADKHLGEFASLIDDGGIRLVYVGRGGHDLHRSISPLFAAFKRGLVQYPDRFAQIRIYFIGTSYA